jgi:hypothetical protein
VYYKVFKPDGVIPCKKPVNPRDPYLARIEAVHIAPPQTVWSAIRCICKAEGIGRPSEIVVMELFESVTKAAPMERHQHLPILKRTFWKRGLGSDPRKPLSLVQVRDPLELTIVANQGE